MPVQSYTRVRTPGGPGTTRLRETLVKSRNLVSIRLLREFGVDLALDYIERFGRRLWRRIMLR